ncbi:nondiscriminating glutamyl-tRNA synthetase [Geomicrobium halophilum]|uniref:Glutamate--tRNA ligase n=1 Tax=Geomicrobium halophilum TaxID=549000 RepID=A0A841Q0S3_9BACL|nr:glutamate--tRNA ligase [Geomicrobium halophilum]MBB6451433.1 nondiscriminating glutamyl-tRNA synthetase [Geomicrobium halophilum]
MTQEVRVRFAPSPTGHLHIGGARQALFNYLFARHHNGKFIVRIEDTDQARNIEDATDKLMQSLKWLGLDWDESIENGGPYAPYRSSERFGIYEKYLKQLIEEKKAYYCYMTTEELEAEREAQVARGEMPMYSGRDRDLTREQQQAYEEQGIQPVVRFRVPDDEDSVVIDDVIRGEVSFDTDGIGDFVIARSDGVPTYNFAVVIDDYLMKISHVIRGEEHLSNAPRQALLYNAYGLEQPRFAHAPLILNEDRQKMSKRDETIMQFVEQYRDSGYLPEALLNFLALLGWSPGSEEEIFTMDELIEKFSLDRVSKAPAVFDKDKLAWVNNRYMKDADPERLTDLVIPHLQKADQLDENYTNEDREWLKKLVEIYQEQMHYAEEFVELTSLFFQSTISYEGDARTVLSDDHVPEVMASFSEQLNNVETFEAPEIKKAIKATQKETGHKGKQLFMPIRAAVTGQTHGPELPQAIALLGKETVQARLEEARHLEK